MSEVGQICQYCSEPRGAECKQAVCRGLWVDARTTTEYLAEIEKFKAANRDLSESNIRRREEVARLYRLLATVHRGLMNLQPHIEQACLPGRAVFIDNYVDPLLGEVGKALEMLANQPRRLEAHPDDAAVDRFAAAMKVKLAAARAKGREGWDDPDRCSDEFLARELVQHLRKGNLGTFEDVANFSMMLHQRGADPSVLASAAEPQVPDMIDMISRFLAWKLPASVRPDPCVMDPDYPHRYGTNLLTADQAQAMLEHVMQGLPSRPVYTCDGKGGSYAIIGESIGAGTCRGQTNVVYRDLKSDQLYHRTPSDFDERMKLL
ncbi:hypothetical protein D9M69_433580 [compost metagenome]